MRVIELRNVSKKYPLRFRKGAIVRDLIPRLLSPNMVRDFWALREINLNVNKGEVVGIIGDNGAGKTTLLSIIAGITSPTEGEVSTQGKVYPLLSLGAGFHRELSGEDNIYLNGLLLGLRMEEIKERMGEIIEFSELGGFIKLPIYTYSSGMLLRLGFAIAVFVDFDILLVDEILAVGDINFQNKCIGKIKEFIQANRTIVISSQSLDLIQELCSRVLLLDSGKIIKDGNPGEVVSFYRELLSQKENMVTGIQLVKNIPEDIDRIKPGWGKKFGNGKAEILKVEFIGKDGKREDFRVGEPLIISVDAEIREEIYNPHFGVAIFRDDYVYCHGPNTKFDNIKIKKLKKGRINFQLHYPEFILNGGKYKVSVAIWDEHEIDPYVYHCAYYDVVIRSSSGSSMLAEVEHNWEKNILKDYRESNPQKRYHLHRIGIYDGNLKEKEVFLTGEYLAVGIDLMVREEFKFQVALLKSNGVLCHSADLELQEGRYHLLLEYPQIPFLSGDFIFKFSLVSGNGEEILGWKKFIILAKIRDHGLIFMPHFWKLNIE